MNQLQQFTHEMGTIRMVQIKGEPWFVAKDLASILGYADPNKAIRTHVDTEDKLEDKTALSLGQRGGWLINESGLYSLILSSKLPTAKDFKHWVTSEVLPSIRKTGSYSNLEALWQEITTPDNLIKVCENWKSEIEKNKVLTAKIESDKPKVVFADAVSVSDTTILIGELAKIIKQNGVDMGQQRLFAWLRDNSYLIKREGTDKNTPTQKSMELGLFKVKETAVTHSDGHVTISKTTKVTGKGQTYFLNKFLAEKDEE